VFTIFDETNQPLACFAGKPGQVVLTSLAPIMDNPAQTTHLGPVTPAPRANQEVEAHA
jgi:hypothetical protein